jgi:hypothetical protein
MLFYWKIKKKYSKEQIMILGYTCYKEMIYSCSKMSTDFNSVLIQRN